MRKVGIVLVSLFILGILLVLGINFYVVFSTKSQFSSIDDLKDINDIDCILVLGAGIWGDKPSPMLEDRLLFGIDLYKNGVAPKIIVSGDHGREEYDEVNIMKDFITEQDIPSEDVFMDHAGFSTYDSIYRALHIFEAKKIVIVTQDYHLYRALYIASSLGIEAYGISSNPRKYGNQLPRDVREILARDKDFVKCIFKPESTYLGETISVSGNGNITNDKDS